MDIELYNNYIMCVYESGSMTKAAKKLGISQPALSLGLGNIEKRIGFKIFNRKKSPLQLTKEGKVYLEYLYKHRQIMVDYQRKIKDISDITGNRLTIGGPVVYVESLIVKAVIELRKEYPNCEIVIKNGAVPELIEKTKKGDVDCFISTSDDLPEDFAKEKIKQERIYLCIPRDWEINTRLKDYKIDVGGTGDCFDYSVLDGLEFIFLEEEQPLQKKITKFLAENQIFPLNYLIVNQVPVSVTLSAFGEGIAFVSEEALLSSGCIDKWCIYTLPDNIFGRDIYVAYDKEHYLPNACKKLIEILKSIF